MLRILCVFQMCDKPHNERIEPVPRKRIEPFVWEDSDFFLIYQKNGIWINFFIKNRLNSNAVFRYEFNVYFKFFQNPIMNESRPSRGNGLNRYHDEASDFFLIYQKMVFLSIFL